MEIRIRANALRQIPQRAVPTVFRIFSKFLEIRKLAKVQKFGLSVKQDKKKE
jgi:hypothetical protein